MQQIKGPLRAVAAAVCRCAPPCTYLFPLLLCARAKNISDVLLKSAVDTGITALCFYLIGYGLQMGVGDTPPNGE